MASTAGHGFWVSSLNPTTLHYKQAIFNYLVNTFNFPMTEPVAPAVYY